MKISKIVPQKKNKSRCSLYINGDFKCGLSCDIIIRHDLHEGDEISEIQLNNVLLEEEKSKIRSRAFRILNYRDRSELEMKQRLLDVGFDEHLILEVIDEFVADTTLDDTRFAKAFVHDHTHIKPRGNTYIRKQLQKKGVPSVTIEQVLQQRDEQTLIKQFITRHCHNFDINNLKDKQKIVNRLLRRGFSSSIIYDVVQNYKNNNEK